MGDSESNNKLYHKARIIIAKPNRPTGRIENVNNALLLVCSEPVHLPE